MLRGNVRGAAAVKVSLFALLDSDRCAREPNSHRLEIGPFRAGVPPDVSSACEMGAGSSPCGRAGPSF